MAMVCIAVEVEFDSTSSHDECVDFLVSSIRNGLRGLYPLCVNPRVAYVHSDQLAIHGPNRVVNSVPDSVGHAVSTDSTGFGVDSPGAVAVGESKERCADSVPLPHATAIVDAYFHHLVDAPVHIPRELSDCD